MQTRKRQLGSKIDREVNTELLDAKIKYSQNKILPTCNQKLASRWILERRDLSCLTGIFLWKKKKQLEIFVDVFLLSVSDFFRNKHCDLYLIITKRESECEE